MFMWSGNFSRQGFSKLKISSLLHVSMMSENDLCDIFQARNPDTQRFSCHRKTPFKQRRLDFSLVSDSNKNKLCSLQEGSRRQGYWKFNSLLIENKTLSSP